MSSFPGMMLGGESERVEGEKSEVDLLALWLLRVGIEHSGELVMTRLWDVAVRAGVLADLRRGRRLTEIDRSGLTMTVDQPRSRGHPGIRVAARINAGIYVADDGCGRADRSRVTPCLGRRELTAPNIAPPPGYALNRSTSPHPRAPSLAADG